MCARKRGIVHAARYVEHSLGDEFRDQLTLRESPKHEFVRVLSDRLTRKRQIEIAEREFDITQLLKRL